MNRKISYTISVLILLILSLFTTESQNIYAEVYGSISGKVVFAETGEPVKGILVSISVLDPKTCTPLSCSISSAIKTDVNGNYVFNRIPPGEYKINLSDITTEYNHYYYDTSMGRLASGYSDADCEKYKLFVGKKSVDDYVYGRVYESHKLPIKFLLGKNITELNILLKKVYGTISGRVLRQDNGLFDGSIRVEPASIVDNNTYYSRYYGIWVEKNDGSFLLDLLADSVDWNLFITYSPSYSMFKTEFGIKRSINYGYKHSNSIDTRGAKDVKDIIIYPVFDTTTGFVVTVYDTSQIFLEGIEVELIHKNRLGQKEYSMLASTDEDGKVFFKAVPSGTYNITLTKLMMVEEERSIGRGKYAKKIKELVQGWKTYEYPEAIEIILNNILKKNLIYEENKTILKTPLYLKSSLERKCFSLADDLCGAVCNNLKDAECASEGPCPTPASDPSDPCPGATCGGDTKCTSIGEGAGLPVPTINCSNPEFYDIVAVHENVHVGQLAPCSQYKTWEEYFSKIRANRCAWEHAAYSAEIPYWEGLRDRCRNVLNLGNDWCDEQFAVNDPIIPEPLYYSQLPDAAILDNGASEQMQSLLSTFRYGNILTDITTTPQELFSYSKVCVIPTGGLVGNDSSPQFKALLEQYVSAGGFIVVMATQHNSDLSCIPVPEGESLNGYMWREDMSCTANSIEIQDWHNILSGQSKNILSEPVDGYFTSWPKDAKILLRRSKNGQPCMLLYKYGSGWVLATTIYTDYGYSVGQASTSGKALLRNIITWARNSVEMIEYRPGSSINIPITITNKTEKESASVSVSVSVLTPDGAEKEKIPLNLPLQKGETGAYTYTGTAGQELGIWRIEYALLDSAGIEMQKESAGANFAVSSPPANIKPAPDLSFSVQSNTENYVKGSSAVFTIISWNTSDEERNITCKYFFPHHWWNTQNVQ
ncbi:hypothetical protein HY745_13860, partial [Candidatus Desantisbacteria bacterium]|nr:hypothetical protein [Candidatus Desantisbacteria bacterium]